MHPTSAPAPPGWSLGIARRRARPLGAQAKPYLAATSAADRRFAAVFAVLRNPGLSPFVRGGVPRTTRLDRIDNYRENWWCAPSEGDEGGGLTACFPGPQRAEARLEQAKLRAAGPAPNYLARQVLDYARSNPGDPRIPEALALAVRATRFGCVDADTTKWSRAAFALLHRQYPASPWAKATRYGY